LNQKTLEQKSFLERFGAAMFIVIASSAFAVGSPLARFARPAHPLLLAFGRVAIASAVLFALDAPGVVRHARALPRKTLRTIAVCGALLGVHFALFQAGLDATSVPAAVSLVSLEPLSVIVCAFLVHGVRPTRREQIGVGLATLGALIVSRAAGSGEHKLFGDLLVLAAGFLYGFYVAAARSIQDALPPRQAATLIYAVAAIVLAAILPFVHAWTGVTSLPLRSFAVIGVIALVPTIIGHTAVQAASRKLPPAIVALACPGETLGGLVIGAILLGAKPMGLELAGAAVILAGVLVAILAPGAEPKATEARGEESVDGRAALGTAAASAPAVLDEGAPPKA